MLINHKWNTIRRRLLQVRRHSSNGPRSCVDVCAYLKSPEVHETHDTLSSPIINRYLTLAQYQTVSPIC